MQIAAVGEVGTLATAVVRRGDSPSFGDALTSAIDGLAASLTNADALAGSVSAGKASIAEAAIARAKADVMLEVAAITAARVSGAISTLVQTQV